LYKGASENELSEVAPLTSYTPRYSALTRAQDYDMDVSNYFGREGTILYLNIWFIGSDRPAFINAGTEFRYG